MRCPKCRGETTMRASGPDDRWKYGSQRCLDCGHEGDWGAFYLATSPVDDLQLEVTGHLHLSHNLESTTWINLRVLRSLLANHGLAIVPAPSSTGELPKWHVNSVTTAEEWDDAGRSVGIRGPGAMQQAKHMADAACESLGLAYAETAPIDIRNAVERLKQREKA